MNIPERIPLDIYPTTPHGAERIVIEKTKTAQKLIDNMLNQHYQYKDLSHREEIQIISNLEKLDLDKDWHSKGSEGSIFKIKVTQEDGSIKEFVAAKKRYDNEPDDEGSMHHTTEVATSGKSYNQTVRVPILKAIISLSTEEKIIIMEFIDGKTIYQLHLEKILQKRGIPFGEFRSDLEAESMMFKVLNLNPLVEEDCKKFEKIYYQERKHIKLFSKQQGALYKNAMREFIADMHEAGIYHRDLSNPRNSMISETGEYIVIDFGKSKNVKGVSLSKEQIYGQQEGEMEGVYPTDEEVLGVIYANTKTDEDEELEKQAKESKDIRRSIEKGKSFSEYLHAYPFQWIKNEEKKKGILEKAKKLAQTSKRIRLNQLEDAKNAEEKYILLFAQSQENIAPLLDEITSKKKTIQDNIAKVDYKKAHIPYSTLALGPEKVAIHNDVCNKEIGKYQASIKKLGDLEEILMYLQSLQK